MRQLFINGNLMDLDEKTVIGLTIQNCDISDIGEKKFSITNSFSIPKTSRNKRNLYFIENINSISSLVYDAVLVDYIDSNVILLKNAKGYIKSISDVYNLVIISSGSIVDVLKLKNLRELMRESHISISSSKYWGNFIADIIANNTGGYCVNLWAFQQNNYSTNQLMDGHFGVRVSKVFEWIEDFTGYSLINSNTLTDDSNFNVLSVPFYDLIPFSLTDDGTNGNDYDLFLYDSAGLSSVPYYSSYIIPSYEYYGDVTVMDFLKAIAIMFNCIIDIDDNFKTIKLHKFNDIITGDVQDWSGKIIKSNKEFSIGKYLQNNIIDYLKDDGVSENLARVSFESNNLNLSTEKKINIDVIIPRALENIWLLGSNDKTEVNFTAKPLSKLMFFIDDSLSSSNYNLDSNFLIGASIGTDTTNTSLMEVLIYDFTSNYSGLETILTNPIFYNCDMNLSLLDIYSFKVDNLYKIDELGGVFYVNKIVGYNSKSKQGTKVELIKIK